MTESPPPDLAPSTQSDGRQSDGRQSDGRQSDGVLVAACQLLLDIDDPATNLATMAAAVTNASRRGARLVVLPELAASGCCFRTRAEAAAAAEPLDGPTVSLLADLTERGGGVVVSGLCERVGDNVFNSAVVVEDGRLVAAYRKVHLWGEENRLFDRGCEPPPVVATAVGNVAPMVCYDAEFPEWVRLAADAGADVVCVPANWPLLPRPRNERPLEVLKAQALAGIYRTYVLVADRCGAERGQDWIGGSVVVGPDGYLRAGPAVVADGPAQPATLVARIDPRLARAKEIGPHNDARADRRPELYAG